MQSFRWYSALKLLTRTDVAVISLILLSGVISSLYVISGNSKKSQVIIYKNNTVFATEYLNKNQIIPIDSLLYVEISNGKARIIHSTCKNLTCERIGWSNTQPIICIPNKIYLEFPKGKSEDIFITH